ncbi:hypothetical protein WH50_13895 [Pokkaliibacter plantistimulans]|uniref:Uncharacterized protein n=1 Tax=Pokkaliibacter plantistimulans TaxID=1635171 RepID=A0ABX5LVI7_9GAMM|nr:hypothetical protein WH50_13895 [Pokkaliibacter plantistimulans]
MLSQKKADRKKARMVCYLHYGQRIRCIEFGKIAANFSNLTRTQFTYLSRLVSFIPLDQRCVVQKAPFTHPLLPARVMVCTGV